LRSPVHVCGDWFVRPAFNADNPAAECVTATGDFNDAVTIRC